MDRLREDLGIEHVDLVKGHGGIFEVAVDGVVVAKKTAGQFPDEPTIVAKVREALGGR